MSYTIAIAGKGGTGKTTVAALTVSRLIARGSKPVLAVDADPNSCLDSALGVAVTQTVGAVREEAREMAGKGLGAGVSKQEMLELKIHEMVEQGMALTGAWVDVERGLLSTIVLEMGGSSRMCATWKKGEPVVLMGPTGAATEIPSSSSGSAPVIILAPSAMVASFICPNNKGNMLL